MIHDSQLHGFIIHHESKKSTEFSSLTVTGTVTAPPAGPPAKRQKTSSSSSLLSTTVSGEMAARNLQLQLEQRLQSAEEENARLKEEVQRSKIAYMKYQFSKQAVVDPLTSQPWD